MISGDHFWLLAVAMALDAAIGDPDFIWGRVPHPVTLIGWLIAFLDRLFNRSGLDAVWLGALGALALAIVVAIVTAMGFALELAFARSFGWLGTILVVAIVLAGRSLYDHVAAVGAALPINLDAARNAVARIVGRDPASLDESRICRAAIESAAENFSDGVVAPAIWFLLLGLPGLFAYKAINTADSMIGHLSPRYRAFGWAAARLDDLLNLPASRLAGTLIAFAAPLAGGKIGASLRVMLTDARKHRSPNAGWPEAAMAAALGLALAGPRRYAGIIVNDPFLNEHGRREATAADIRRALRVYLGANALAFIVVLTVALAVALA